METGYSLLSLRVAGVETGVLRLAKFRDVIIPYSQHFFEKGKPTISTPWELESSFEIQLSNIWNTFFKHFQESKKFKNSIF